MGSKNMTILINPAKNKDGYKPFSTQVEVSKSKYVKNCTLVPNEMLDPKDRASLIKDIKIEILLEDGVKKIVISQSGKTKIRKGTLFNASASNITFQLNLPDVGISICNFGKIEKKKRLEV
jgi:hypothetical protein